MSKKLKDPLRLLWDHERKVLGQALDEWLKTKRAALAYAQASQRTGTDALEQEVTNGQALRTRLSMFDELVPAASPDDPYAPGGPLQNVQGPVEDIGDDA